MMMVVVITNDRLVVSIQDPNEGIAMNTAVYVPNAQMACGMMEES